MDDEYTKCSNRWLAETLAKAERSTAADSRRVTVTEGQSAEDSFAASGGAPPKLSGRDLAMARMKAGGRPLPADLAPSKLAGRDLAMARMKAGGVLPGERAAR